MNGVSRLPPVSVCAHKPKVSAPSYMQGVETFGRMRKLGFGELLKLQTCFYLCRILQKVQDFVLREAGEVKIVQKVQHF